MKSRVNFSSTSLILTTLVIGLLLLGCIFTYGEVAFWYILAITIILLVFAAFYTPLSVSANEETVKIYSPVKTHSIPMRRIVKCELFQPTMGAIRICGSGGFMGYWGMFREGDVGRYMAYYGKSSDCFMLHLDNGDKYLLGCNAPKEMTDFITSQIRQ